MQQVNQSFSNLGLSESLFNNLASLGYEQMTPIQLQTLPLMMNGTDVIAQAQTGSGKTAAFGLALLHALNVALFAVQVLVMCPTRELSEQVSQAIRRLARLTPNVKVLNLSGGMPKRPQTDSLKHGAHVVVGTPGRIQQHLDDNALSLEKLKILILDEADRMLDMGFLDAIKSIIRECPTARQTLLFSATYPAEIEKLAHNFMRHPQRIVIEALQTEPDIEQRFYEVSHATQKFSLLKLLLLHYKATSILIFCNTKEQTTQVSRRLAQEGFSSIALNGDMEQVDRDIAMIRFGNKSCSILVATDVAARGIDIKELPLVINYDLAFEPEVHIHRIGRTGRAGHQGLALSITVPADAERLCIIEAALGRPLTFASPDTLILNTPVFSPDMVTLCLSAGRKDKIRPGDVLGALTKDAGLPGHTIEKIDITALYSYVAIQKSYVDKAYKYFRHGKLKGRKVAVKKI
jgi:ATP-independent RNA helicase DbpA